MSARIYLHPSRSPPLPKRGAGRDGLLFEREKRIGVARPGSRPAAVAFRGTGEHHSTLAGVGVIERLRHGIDRARWHSSGLESCECSLTCQRGKERRERLLQDGAIANPGAVAGKPRVRRRAGHSRASHKQRNWASLPTATTMKPSAVRNS